MDFAEDSREPEITSVCSLDEHSLSHRLCPLALIAYMNYQRYLTPYLLSEMCGSLADRYRETEMFTGDRSFILRPCSVSHS